MSDFFNKGKGGRDGNRFSKGNFGRNTSRPGSREGVSGGYRREGDNARPRFNNQGGGFGERPEGGFQRPSRDGQSRFNKQRPSYNAGAEGGFRPRFNAGGEGQRPSFNRGEGGQRSSFNRGEGHQNTGFAPRKRTGNYDPHAKYSAKKRLEYKEEHFDPNAPIRLNKYLANAGVCSRRDADKYIEAGVVTVNGEVVTELGARVMRTDVVCFHGEAVKLEKKVYVLLNKPKGYVTTSEDPQNRKTVMDLVQGACPERIYPVGRLDRNTTGVLLLTNDGELASKLTHPKFLKKKIYHVHTDQNVSAADIRQIAEGITLEDGMIKADAIEYASPTDKKQVGIEIHSGKNRIVRRIFESLGYHVVKLDRVYFAGLTKKNVRRGDWRYLTEKEVSMLRMGAFE